MWGRRILQTLLQKRIRRIEVIQAKRGSEGGLDALHIIQALKDSRVQRQLCKASTKGNRETLELFQKITGSCNKTIFKMLFHQATKP